MPLTVWWFNLKNLNKLMYWYSILVFLGLSSIGIWLPCSHFLNWKKIMQLDLVSNCMFIIVISKQLRQACNYMFGFITTSSRHNITYKLKKILSSALTMSLSLPKYACPSLYKYGSWSETGPLGENSSYTCCCFLKVSAFFFAMYFSI